MVKFYVEDDNGDFVLDQQPEQGDCSFMSDDDDDLDGQSDQGEDGFMSSLHERSSSDQEEDDGSSMSDDADSSLDEQSNQEEEDDGNFVDQDPDRNFVDQDPDRQADLIAAFLRGASEYDVIHLTGRPGPRLRFRRYLAAEDYAAAEDAEDEDEDEDDDEDEDEDDPFPVEEPPAAASEAAVAALEAAEAPADDCCPVCLQQDDDGAWRRVAACGHRFHVACVAQWLQVKLSCPVCRCPAADADPTAPRRDDAAEEPSRPRPLPDIVEEMLSVSDEESVVLENSSRRREFMATRNLTSTGDSSGVSAGAA